MGMVLSLVAVSDGNLTRILADPPLVMRVVAPEDPEAYQDARKDRRGFLQKLIGGKQAPASVPDLELTDGEGETIDLDKAWQGIHYLLTGAALEGEGPSSYLLAGGALVGDVDVGLGPARAFTAREVTELRDALASVSNDELRRRFNPEEMMKLDIYPGIWDRDPADDDTLGYCIENVEILRQFLDKLVARKQGALIFLG